jgi:hypothetical protein
MDLGSIDDGEVMDWMLACHTNDPKYLNCVISPVCAYIEAVRVNECMCYGVGYYEMGEVLLKKRPTAPGIYFTDFIQNLVSETFISHRTFCEKCVFKWENVPPFRFQDWLFTQHGNIPHFERLQEQVLSYIPQYLRSDIKGETEMEHLFYLYLSFLHDMGQLRGAFVSSEIARQKLEQLANLLQKMLKDAQLDALSQSNFFITNGQYITGIRRGVPILYLVIDGIEKCPICSDETANKHKDPMIVSHSNVKAVLAYSGTEKLPGDWKEVPEGKSFIIESDCTIQII